MASQTKSIGTSSFLATSIPLRVGKTTVRRGALTVRAEQVRKWVFLVEVVSQVTRREGLMGMVAGVGALLSASPSFAAYGEAANVFGKVTDTSGKSQKTALKFDLLFRIHSFDHGGVLASGAVQMEPFSRA